jgi:hypothetical protein
MAFPIDLMLWGTAHSPEKFCCCVFASAPQAREDRLERRDYTNQRPCSSDARSSSDVRANESATAFSFAGCRASGVQPLGNTFERRLICLSQHLRWSNGSQIAGSGLLQAARSLNSSSGRRPPDVLRTALISASSSASVRCSSRRPSRPFCAGPTLFCAPGPSAHPRLSAIGNSGRYRPCASRWWTRRRAALSIANIRDVARSSARASMWQYQKVTQLNDPPRSSDPARHRSASPCANSGAGDLYTMERLLFRRRVQLRRR